MSDFTALIPRPLHGAVLILLLSIVGYASWRGFERMQEGANRWTAAAVALAAGLAVRSAALWLANGHLAHRHA